jgi:IstB-like ATP binding protein
MLGNPGLGQTHLATSLALAACRQGYKVRFYTAAGLVNDLIQAHDDHRLPRVLAAALQQPRIVVDELGFIPFAPPGAPLMFQFGSSLYERVALIITTHLRFADGTQVFGDERLTAALLDRLTYRAHLLDFGGESFRVRQRLPRDTQQPRGEWAMDRDGVWNTPAPVCRDLSRGRRVPHPVEHAARFPHCPPPRQRWLTFHTKEVIPRQPSPLVQRWRPFR